MKLVSPQSMETLPEEGRVFVEVTSAASRERYVIDSPVQVKTIREYYLRIPSLYEIVHAWSYTATTNPNEEEPT